MSASNTASKTFDCASTEQLVSTNNAVTPICLQSIVRLSELEQAARLMDKNISRGLLHLKISVGMDSIDLAQKENRFAFATAMNAIEGISISGENDRDIVFRLVRITAQIWQTHPFREGNTRSVIVFAVLLANAMGFAVEHEVFKTNAAYVQSALVWASQGIYSKYEYLERLFFDAILHEDTADKQGVAGNHGKYAQIGGYNVKDYKERPHEYVDSK